MFHLPGKHNQESHGHGGTTGASQSNESAAEVADRLGSLGGREFGDGLTLSEPTRQTFGGTELIRFNVHDRNGKSVGKVTRAFETDENGVWATHATLSLDPKAQKRGFATAFNKAAEYEYREAGVQGITLEAAKDGRVVWAKAGYDWNPKMKTDNARELDKIGFSLEKSGSSLGSVIRDKSRHDAPDFPTPADVLAEPGGEAALRASGSWYGVKYLKEQAMTARDDG
jgi:GNAT superfamily N-acetyltransferase